MTSGQALQLMAVIAQKLGKIGLDFDGAETLIAKPDLTRRRLQALVGEKSIQVVPQHQWATIESLHFGSDRSHRQEDVGEFLTIDPQLKKVLDGEDKIVDRCTAGVYHRCDVVRDISEDDGALYPVFREVLQHHGTDDSMWDLLHERHALWAVDDVLGFLRDEIHEGKDPLGLTETCEEAVFPVLLTKKDNGFRVGFLFVHKSSLVRQKQTWSAGIVEGKQVMCFVRKLIYFANDPRDTTK